ncbi:MAG: acyl-CoA dehydrogenase [Proteobacteria bacterium]|nr:acyl-CoA dehydrogenase [Pseudomonadota bacterium]MBU1583182.1 acyl-CoA dehydrogenase [Pseudomonadota bacterium]MBU2454594.1 acyl-CoA dehydrogenase [Pseudomonadota bacterium]MBU2631716.1 acyl-CoA dehydrogenase [Pseudomonadota bacterium]
MTDKFMSMKNLKFTLHSRGGKYCSKTPDYLKDHTAKTIDLVLKAAFDLGKKAMHPMFEEMDRQPPALINGNVLVHKGVRPMLETLGKDGWISASFPEKWKGDDMPASLIHCINFIFAAANYSASVYAGLTMGAANLILSFGSEKLKNIYLSPLLAGKWQGTMALTEPEAGSSLGDLCCEALPVEEGHYKINGEKIFISAGDHDGVDNVIHLMLARIKGAPSGTKGISLFLVPKFRPDEQGNLMDNDLIVTQVFHKLGYRGAPIVGLRMGEKDNCTGYLVGRENKGLSYMFQMMNGARLEVGMGATAIATAAYHAALDYCRTRHQGRKITAPKDSAPVPIIQHPDVKRMLLFQRAVAEGSLALILQCGMYEDILARDPSQTDCHLLLELLTPIAKTYPSEMGILSTSNAIQCFGGYGYCDDFPVEQHFRDMRIHTIHEGTTGIQGMDLLARKVTAENGRAMVLLKEEILLTAEKAGRWAELEDMADTLLSNITLLEKVTMEMTAVAGKKGLDAYLANATLYLEMFGIVVIAWQWLSMAQKAAEKLEQERTKKTDRLFYEGKIHVATYFYSHELARVKSLSMTLQSETMVTLAMPEVCFTD